MTDAWTATRAELKNQVGAAFFDAQFASLRLMRHDDARWVLGTHDEMIALVTEKNYRGLIEACVEMATGATVVVAIETVAGLAPEPEPSDDAAGQLVLLFGDNGSGRACANEDDAEPAVVARMGAAAFDARPHVGARSPHVAAQVNAADAAALAGLSPRADLGAFVVGTSNEFAYEAARAVVERPGQLYNPLFLYGGVGLGKTHLMNAVGLGILGHTPSARVRYLSAETFVNELIDSIGARRMDEFRQKNRTDVDVLLIDDVQFIAGKERTQAEFFHTFNALYQAGRQIVVTSDRIPQEMPELEERLVSRLTMGLIVDIQPPDFETRVAILRQKARELGFDAPTTVCEYIAQQIRANVRELHGALLRIGTFARLRNEPLSLSLAQAQLDRVHRDRSAGVTAETVLRVTADVFGVPAKEIKGRKRCATVALPRKVAMYVARTMTSASFPELGEVFGGRDHTTVMSAVRSVERMLESGDPVRTKIEAVERRLAL